MKNVFEVLEPEVANMDAKLILSLGGVTGLSIAISLKRIADRLERITILPGEDSASRGQLNVGAEIGNSTI